METSPECQTTKEKKIRIADAKEVGVGNPAEETYRYPNPDGSYGDIVGSQWAIVCFS